MKSWEAIWTEIEGAFETNYRNRSDEQRDIAILGLCHALRIMEKDFYILKQIVPTEYGYWWTMGSAGRAGRAFFAGLMAAMGDKGFESFLKWCKENPE